MPEFKVGDRVRLKPNPMYCGSAKEDCENGVEFEVIGQDGPDTYYLTAAPGFKSAISEVTANGTRYHWMTPASALEVIPQALTSREELEALYD